MIRLVQTIRDLCIHLDREVTMKTHISKVVSSCYHQLRRIRQVHWFVRQGVTQQLISALILSQLDYCNSLMSNLPGSIIHSLQHALNAAARVVMNVSLRDHVKWAFKWLHLLSIEQRINIQGVSLHEPRHHETSTTIPGRLCSHSYCSQWQILGEVSWLSGLRSAKNKN